MARPSRRRVQILGNYSVMKVKRAFLIGYGEEVPAPVAVCTDDGQKAMARPAFAHLPLKGRFLLALTHEIGRRNQDGKLLAPDDNALKPRKVQTCGNGVALAAFEGAQPAEVHELLAGQIA